MVLALACAARGEEPAPVPDDVEVQRPDNTVVEHTPGLRVLTWNIQYGEDQGEKANGWPDRKRILKELLLREKPDLLCVQEALKNQVEFIEKLFPEHKRIGVGRDDGKEAGEFCAIFYDAKRLEATESGTFWLSETPDKPSRCWTDNYNRTCVWARFRDKLENKKCLLFNTHFPMNSAARLKSAKLFTKKIREEKSNDPIALVGDFNCAPGSKEWRFFAWAGLVNSETAAGEAFLRKTFMYSGVPISTLDAIFVGKGWGVRGHKVVEDAVEKHFASDHFGVEALLSLSGPSVRIDNVDPKKLGFQGDPLAEPEEKTGAPAKDDAGKTGQR
ncbi:MAG: endonuclease/exonuclease/phosphatase family protein [Planctomycetes bacterium]|nr:endonuclease/exonuclease/phosphatase family protein [Planctomycetota bacterium]